MEVTKINREKKTIEITKSDGDIINLNWNELDELITFLRKIGYINFNLTLKYNHHLPEIKFAEMTDGKWGIKRL